MVSLPERNASISYHLTSQPGAGPRASRGFRETPDLWLPLFAGIPRLLQSTMVARGVCGWYAGTYLFYCPSLHGSFFGLFLVFFLGSPVFSSCSGFSVVLAFFGVFRISADSRFCPRVAASCQLPAGTAWMETLPSGLSEGLRQSSAGIPWMETLPARGGVQHYEHWLVRNTSVPPSRWDFTST